MIIQVRNLLHENTPKTFLTNTEVAGTGVLRWRNPTGFQASWAIQIGEIGEEQSEVVILGTAVPAGTAGTLTANTLYEHPADTPIYAIKYNQVVFERSTAGTAGTATPMSEGTVTYQADQLVSQFEDSSGSATYAYRTYFRNSVLSQVTTESDWITSGGFSFYSLAKVRDRIRGKLWSDVYLTDDTLNDWINEYKDQMANAVISINEGYSMGTVDVPFGTAGLGTVTTADFTSVRRLDVTYNGQDFFLSTKMDVNDYLPNQIFNATRPFHAWTGNDTFIVKPGDNGGTARMTFYRFGTTMVNDTDELPLPFRSYTDGFVNYGLAMACYKDGKDARGREFKNAADQTKAMFVSQMAPRDKTGPTTIDLVEPISGDYY